MKSQATNFLATPPSVVTVATCTLNQWALDFTGNLDRIVESCIQAKAAGATYRLGPELEVCGYGCEDHFYESDTIDHCWESLVEFLTQTEVTLGLLVDLGMPLLHRGVRYNCRVLCYNSQILWIRPKTALADDGNYRESRYFTAYTGCGLETLTLPPFVQDATGQHQVPFGVGYILSHENISLGCESCEELWTPAASHIEASLQGVEILGNASGSHHELRKLDNRLSLMVNATRKCGGVYLYSNQRGCDGGRLYYDGGAIIVCNGHLLAQAPQFDIRDVCVITATINLEEVRSYRASLPSFGIQAMAHQTSLQGNTHKVTTQLDCPQVKLVASSLTQGRSLVTNLSLERELIFSCPEEECCLGPACWLWDYLRRSGASGFLLPLSGGADSSSVATIVSAMCHLVYQRAATGDTQILQDARKICQKPEEWLPSSPQELSNHILHTIFMGTQHSSHNTTSRAQRLGAAIGAYHLSVPMDTLVQAMVTTFSIATNLVPKFEAQGGSRTQDLALQNIQARLRMVTAYVFAQLLPWVRGNSGFLLVLGSANVDEGLRGYMTKYDCSSADLNPIGAISKGDLKRMLLWASERYPELQEVLQEIAGAPPTAELRPLASTADTTAEHSQLDEEEMGMTYEELGWFGRLRKFRRCGPVSMFRALVNQWGNHYSPREIAAKVQRFFYYYAVNRHKMCTLTPSYHAEGYSPDDNRFDLRPFLYNTKWPRQFGIMNLLVERHEAAVVQGDGAKED